MSILKSALIIVPLLWASSSSVYARVVVGLDSAELEADDACFAFKPNPSGNKPCADVAVNKPAKKKPVKSNLQKHVSPYRLTILMKSDEQLIDNINLGHLVSVFGPTTHSEHLVKKGRQVVASPNNSLGLIPEQIEAQKIAEPDFSQLHPQSSAAKLQRYIVLSYENENHLKQAERLLAKNSAVLSFSRVRATDLADFSLRVNDTLSQNARQFQYELFNYYSGGMNLQHENSDIVTAWDKIKGHAYVGIPDSDLEIGHPDFSNYKSQFSYDFVGLDEDVSEPPISVLDTSVIRQLPGRGHGQHVAGIIAADSHNSIGTAGVCWDCSVLFAKVVNDLSKIPAYNFLVDSGAQVINASFRMRSPAVARQTCPTVDSVDFDCAINPNDAVCIALQRIAERDIVHVAAAGNGIFRENYDNTVGCGHYIQFPASDKRVIAVGASNELGQKAGFSNYGVQLDLVAPGVDILSTFVTEFDWNKAGKCGDSFGVEGMPGYGTCTGTSMAAPNITGLTALIRSIDPLLDRHAVKEILISSASEYPIKHSQLAYGIPDALLAVDQTLGTVAGVVLQNRLTPLFSFYSSLAEDSFYTTAPQMAAAAIHGTLLSKTSASSAARFSPAYGYATPQYTEFPDTAPPDDGFYPPLPAPTARAEVYIFTTENNPLDTAQPLVPLYRMSYKSTDSDNLDHIYIAGQTYLLIAENAGYVKDGIEGYVYSKDYPQPEGTVALYRRYDAGRDDHAIFPANQLSTMHDSGYIWSPAAGDTIAYVYPNQDADNDGLIDGFENLIGTCDNNPDSNGDGRSDGMEVLGYPRTDPLHQFNGVCDSTLVSHPWKDNAVGVIYTNNAWHYALGYHFTPLVDGTIDQLGGYFNGAKQVKLFNKTTGAVLAEATVSSANKWNFSTIAPVSVQANQQYTVAVYMAGAGGSYRYTGGATFPMLVNNLRIDSSTYAYTGSSSNRIPTNTASPYYMYGQVDVRFTQQ
ncbi:MAG: S8 family serine peptidase [Methyloprofundus sp.]|nr:S8 family serine peptidase [Methyloprofundus sp.]